MSLMRFAMSMKGFVAAALGLAVLGSAAFAQSGPVATACKDDLAKLCAGKKHESREARTCLEENKAKVAAACKAALESTGGGQGKGAGKGKN
ncbi:MAG: hypothetical protein SFW09_04500 [Hyphomicrobiaceae bacterium]|nr:hypothetical protein [Hyphomicrobiaceae bacterium]